MRLNINLVSLKYIKMQDSPPPLSSLNFEIMLYIDYLYTFIYEIFSIGFFLYKAYSLTYPSNSLGPEVVGTFLFMFL